MTAKEFDAYFEKQDVGDLLDISKVKVNKKVQRVNIDFPINMLRQLDRESRRIGVSRTALIKMYLAEKMESVIGSS